MRSCEPLPPDSRPAAPELPKKVMKPRQSRRTLNAIARLALAGMLLLGAALQAAAEEGLDPHPLTSARQQMAMREIETREDNITADLIRPRSRRERVPAAVIINSSGGITAHTELFYGRLLAQNSVAALVVDSFAPRANALTRPPISRNSATPQSVTRRSGRLSLACRTALDRCKPHYRDGHVKGGIAPPSSPRSRGDRRLYGVTDVRFAAHVAIAPACKFRQRPTRVRPGAPLFFMLAENR